jgi:hypothetical protein
MKRAVSYSDSFLVLNKKQEGKYEEKYEAISEDMFTLISEGQEPMSGFNQPRRVGSLNALPDAVKSLTPASPRPSAYFSASGPKMPKNTHDSLLAEKTDKCFMYFLLTFKLSFHLFLISGFETFFYFLYVNKSEEDGILKTIDVYYQPIIANCTSGWSNYTKMIVSQILQGTINITQINEAGDVADQTQSTYNRYLLNMSIMYSGVCGGVCTGAILYGVLQRWKISWRSLIAENLGFVIVLGLYELFFFKTIIYNYDTISSAQLNRYILDGLSQCAAS